ncbi:hypothetical protein D3C86_1249420 [compost metagenome]
MAARLVFLVHGHPGIGDDAIGPGHGLVGIVAQHDLAAIVAGPVQELVMRFGTHRHRHCHAVTEAGRAFHEGMQDIIAVTRPGNGLAFDRAAMFLEGHDVSHDLAGMRVVSQGVYNWHGCVLGKLQQARMIRRADHDGVDITRQHLGRIADRFGTTELHFSTGEEKRLATKLAHADIKGDAGAGGGLFEDHCQHLAGKRLFRRSGLGCGLARAGIVENCPQVLRADGRQVKKMFR